MKVFMALIAILTGVLYTEIKEFILNGGLENKLALILIKILFVAIFIVIIGFLDFNYTKYFMNDIFKINVDNDSQDPPPDESAKQQVKLKRALSIARSRSNNRINKFNREFNSE